MTTDKLHSVASVHFQNGSTVIIAKIEGTPNYKTAMKEAPHIHALNAAPLTDSHAVVDPDHCDCYRAYDRVPQNCSAVQNLLKPIQEYFPQADAGVQYCFKALQGHLPPWLGGHSPQVLDASTQSLADMLRVLKFATETHLGAEISNATISVPFPVGRGRTNSTSLDVQLDAAASALDLKLYPPTEAVSDITWAELEARKWKRSPYTYWSCHPDDEGLVLAVEFNDVALTATIHVPDCGGGDTIYYTTRVLHSTELGASHLFKADDWRDTLVDALSSVIALPIRGVETDHINMLVLLGDSARDKRLFHALRDALGDQYDRLIATVRDDGTPARDPQYRGAANAAHGNWKWNHYWTPYREFGCVSPGPHPWFWPMVRNLQRDVRDAVRVVREWLRSAEDKKAEAELAAEQERKRLLKELAQFPIVIGPP